MPVSDILDFNDHITVNFGLATEARLQRNICRAIQALFFVFFGRRKIFESGLHVNMASRAGAETTACMMKWNIMRDSDI
jgi:hypothetical protein